MNATCHLRARDDGATQPTTTVELFFDLVYVSAVEAEPGDPQHGVGLAMMLGGPTLYLVGENLFQRKLTSQTNAKRLTVAGLLILLVPLAGHVTALVLGVIVTTLLAALAVWETRRSGYPFGTQTCVRVEDVGLPLGRKGNG
jgi:low temperature requirement protein LtrA